VKAGDIVLIHFDAISSNQLQLINPSVEKIKLPDILVGF
jgi:hypothetical protein